MLYLLFETATGAAIFQASQIDDVAIFTRNLQDSMTDFGRVSKLIRLTSFRPFSGNDEAAGIHVALEDGGLPETLEIFIKDTLKDVISESATKNVAEEYGDYRTNNVLGVVDYRLKQYIQSHIPGLLCECTPIVIELNRAIRKYLDKFLPDTTLESLTNAQRGLSHLASRQVVAFDKNRADAMIIQSIGYHDTVLKDVNMFFMRLQEWFSYHFPELRNIVKNHKTYTRVVLAVRSRETFLSLPEEERVKVLVEALLADTPVEEKDQKAEIVAQKTAHAIIEAANTSIGQALLPPDCEACMKHATRTLSYFEEKDNNERYLSRKMAEVAPNTAAAIGDDMLASRIIAKAGGVVSLAKYPATTVQLLGAEKALFRALKARSKKTPKYGYLFNAPQVIGLDARNKARIVRAIGCAVAKVSKIDAYASPNDPMSAIHNVENNSYGLAIHKVIDSRIAYITAPKNRKSTVLPMSGAEALRNVARKNLGLPIPEHKAEITQNKVKKSSPNDKKNNNKGKFSKDNRKPSNGKFSGKKDRK